jgi:F0F1-type ATP synthase assembly protein I
VIEPGKTGAYFALFTEIGFILLVPTLLGALAGHWLDEQLGLQFPVFLLIGFLIGLAAGASGVWQLINRFLAKLDD